MVTSLPPLVMRTDASRAIGTGHVMRCLALAQAWQDAGGHCLFACAEITPSLACRLHAENVEFVRMNAEAGSVADAVECSRLARERGAEWIVTDGYQFVSDYQAALKKSGLHLLLIDDYGHADPYDSADVVLNSNPCASAALYERRGAGTRLLLGGRYVLLRREFSRWRDWERIIAQGANKVLVTLGGADPRNVTSRVLRDLEPAGCECMAIVGGSNPHLQELESLAESLHRSRIAKDPGDITELMAWADLAVSSAGVTSLELAFMGLPTVLLTLAENQRLAAQALDESGVGIRLGVPEALSADAIASTVRGLLDDHPRRLRMSQAGQSLVDGRGAERVVEILAGPPLRLRRATEQDCRLLWEWANDPDTRANSFSSELIPWDDHQRWFRAKLSDPACLLLIAADRHERSVGMVRFDIEGAHAVASVNLASEARGLAYGTRLLKLAEREVFGLAPVTRLHAYIKPTNRISLRAFENAGYRRLDDTPVRGQLALHLVLEKDGPQLASLD